MSANPINDCSCPSFSSSQLCDLGRITIEFIDQIGPLLSINGGAHDYFGGVPGKPGRMVTLDWSKLL